MNRGRFIQPLWEHTSRLLQTAAVVLSITPNEHGLAQAVLSALPYQFSRPLRRQQWQQALRPSLRLYLKSYDLTGIRI